MEYLEGKTLKHCVEVKPLGTDEILELAIQIASFLGAQTMQRHAPAATQISAISE